MSDSVVWAQPPESESADDDDDHDEQPGEVDDSFAMRRLRRWLQGMFGPPASDDDETRDA